MNETSTQLQVTVEEKRQQWGNFAVALDQKETQWSLQASALIKKLKLPSKIEEVAECEKILAEVKSELKALDEARMPFTRKMDEISQRCMAPVKSVLPEIEKANKEILRLKKDYAEKQQAIQLKEQEKQRIILQMKQHVIECEAGFKKRITDLVNALYTSCLQAGKTIEQAMADAEQAKTKAKPFDFLIAKKNFSINLLTAGEANDLASEHLVTDSEKWLKLFHDELDLKFTDYAVALQNKEAAIAMAEKEKTEAHAKAEQDQQNEKIAAQLESVSAPVLQPEINFGKALKKEMVVDMPENWQSSLIVMAAFGANFRAIEPMLARVNKLDAFTVGQMKNYLGKIKTDNPEFSFTGLVFKENVK